MRFLGTSPGIADSPVAGGLARFRESYQLMAITFKMAGRPRVTHCAIAKTSPAVNRDLSSGGRWRTGDERVLPWTNGPLIAIRLLIVEGLLSIYGYNFLIGQATKASPTPR